ncbi:MAG: hypothetical protein Ta2B_13980 [Termitinemataceae bacterium]|nr:MAG: hypothetical protein Ta2B_13980 [Termitinemataceae bacterium]
MVDRARQALVKLALKPEWEAKFEPNSYGFRPSRSCPQRGVVSPLLANIVLHGLEFDVKTALMKDIMKYEKSKGKTGRTMKWYRNTRYADEFVVTRESREIVNKAKNYIVEWLKEIGLQLSETKTRIAHTLKKVNDNLIGFNFLGFHMRQFKDWRSRQGFKTLIMPSKEAQSRHIEVIRKRIRSAYAKKQKELIGMLNPVITGWCEYYLKSVAGKIFNKMKHQVFKMTWRWACKRHPKKR